MSQFDLKIGPKIKAFRRKLGIQANKLAEHGTLEATLQQRRQHWPAPPLPPKSASPRMCAMQPSMMRTGVPKGDQAQGLLDWHSTLSGVGGS